MSRRERVLSMRTQYGDDSGGPAAAAPANMMATQLASLQAQLQSSQAQLESALSASPLLAPRPAPPAEEVEAAAEAALPAEEAEAAAAPLAEAAAAAEAEAALPAGEGAERAGEGPAAGDAAPAEAPRQRARTRAAAARDATPRSDVQRSPPCCFGASRPRGPPPVAVSGTAQPQLGVAAATCRGGDGQARVFRGAPMVVVRPALRL